MTDKSLTEEDFLEIERQNFIFMIKSLEKKCEELSSANKSLNKQSVFFKNQYIEELKKNKYLLTIFKKEKETVNKLISKILEILGKK